MGIKETPSGHVVKPPDFKCDHPIGPNVKEPVPNKAFFWALIGSAGSGKTSLMVHLLTDPNCYKKQFYHVHLIAPESSMGSLSDKNNVWAKHPQDKKHGELNFSTLQQIHDLCKQRVDEKPRQTTLVVIDDMAAHLKDNSIETKLRELVYNRRHLGLSIMILVQSYNSMPLSVRKTLSHFSIFKPRNKKETEAIFEELIFISKQQAEEVLRYVYKDSHDFMFGVTETGQLHRNFNELRLGDCQDADADSDDSQTE